MFGSVTDHIHDCGLIRLDYNVTEQLLSPGEAVTTLHTALLAC